MKDYIVCPNCGNDELLWKRDEGSKEDFIYCSDCGNRLYATDDGKMEWWEEIDTIGEKGDLKANIIDYGDKQVIEIYQINSTPLNYAEKIERIIVKEITFEMAKKFRYSSVSCSLKEIKEVNNE